MKRVRTEIDDVVASAKAASSDASASMPALRRRTVSGPAHGFPGHPTVIEEVVDVPEDVTILLRFPCFDFFHHVKVCETAEGNSAEATTQTSTSSQTETQSKTDNLSRLARTNTTTSSSSGSSSTRFAPEALRFKTNTLDTDRPVAVLNGGTANEMIFEGRWCEVCGDGAAVTNRAVVHLRPPSAAASATASTAAAGTVPPSSINAGGAGAAVAPSVHDSAPSVASLFTHVADGVTADEERRLRAAEQQGWTYDRVDVPSAVLVMHRLR